MRERLERLVLAAGIRVVAGRRDEEDAASGGSEVERACGGFAFPWRRLAVGIVEGDSHLDCLAGFERPDAGPDELALAMDLTPGRKGAKVSWHKVIAGGTLRLCALT